VYPADTRDPFESLTLFLAECYIDYHSTPHGYAAAA